MKIIDIEGIGPIYAKKLNQVGIRTVEGLLKTASNPKGRKQLAKASGIDGTLILEWVNRADLYRVKGIGRQYSDLLENAGVDTVKELSRRVPGNLYSRLIEVNQAKNLVNGMPGVKRVESWIHQARMLPLSASSLAGDSTTDAPPPDRKKRSKGK